MITLITANRSLPSLVGVTIHEMAHSWFQALVATNESLYEWMDEGFTSYIESECWEDIPVLHLKKKKTLYLLEASMHQLTIAKNWALSGKEEPLITHADHYTRNRAYGVAAYSKGEVLMHQLSAILGDDLKNEGIKQYLLTGHLSTLALQILRGLWKRCRD